ncbi:uncharacterized protein LOC116416604 [Nasonia vitripennis]|uniref:Uncharacterized protein n=1 Tax=Nasonia vitripennis TaxID=7425 RepID=A0A7M7Q870_NASVI|nr:uncharacterized protein LOC100679793 [Nasonia vitripennis]XP_031781414.1 uncharacterized protein LOC100679793 [Nasonia vitripennis]XP_031781415.1 uncharacterized protein LOC116416604 [Nasonia vitripennis]XP_031781416.1 uncharacterized protein LOC116416604 [Nasonia vitripennis]
MGDSDENGANSNEFYPYLYVHILPKETGAKSQREIIPADVIKKFKYETYKNNKNIYKETKFSFRRGPGGEILKCYVLYAADTYNEVLSKSIAKRFSVPTHSTTLDDIETSHQLHDNTNVSNQENEGNDLSLEEYCDDDIVNDQDDDNRKKMLSNNKWKLKAINKERKKQKVHRENNVLKKYINQRQNESVSDIEDPSFFYYGNFYSDKRY